MDAPQLTPGAITDAVRSIVREQFPELVGGHLVARLGRVRAAGVAAGPVTNLEPRATVDVELLTPAGEPDPSWPLITGVRLAVGWAGPRRGVFGLPKVGALVRVSWLYGQADLPIADPYTAEGFEGPAGIGGDFVVKSGDTEIRITEAGDVTLKATVGKVIRIEGGDVRIGDDVGQRLLTEAFLAHTHPNDGVPAGPVPGSTTAKTRAA